MRSQLIVEDWGGLKFHLKNFLNINYMPEVTCLSTVKVLVKFIKINDQNWILVSNSIRIGG